MRLFSTLILAGFVLGSLRTGHTQAAVPATVDSRFRIPESDDGLPGSGPIRRYDWFRRLWEEKRSGWSRQVQQDQKAVVFLGDSITQGWGDDLGGSFPGIKVANRGISGDTTRGVLIRLQEDVLLLNPAAVVLLIGTNDLEEQADPQTIAGNLRLILEAFKRHNAKMPVVVCKVFPSSATQKRPANQIRRINQLYGEVVKGNPMVTYLETWALFATAEGDALPGEFPDLLHPNQAGYAKWAAALRPILSTLGFGEQGPDSFQAEPGFMSLFNGRNLTGWCYRPTSEADKRAAEGWRKNDPQAPPWPIVTKRVSFRGRASTPDGRFVAKAGRLVVTTPVEGRKIQQIWTTREFSKDFILKLEFRATPGADSGVFIRGLQLQCRDYWLAGPYRKLQHYRPQDWNELVVTVKGGVATATCNGELLEAAMKIPSKGPIGLEGDFGQMEYRRIRLKVLR